MSRLKNPVGPEDHVQGHPDAECTLVEYGDYQCPYCGAAYPIVKKIQAHFGNRLRFVFRNFPMSELHPWAEPAAEVAEFAAVHGKFWQMHDLLYENQHSFGDALFMQLAQALKLSPVQLDESIAQHTFLSRIRADFSSGVRSGVNGTPTFFINGERHNGPFEFDSLRAAIDRASAGSASNPPHVSSAKHS
jgi:protein-disulfide isomerase